MKTNILFRTEISSSIGMGHLMRCLSLAKMLYRNADIRFLLDEYDVRVDQIVMEEGFLCDYLKNSDGSKEMADTPVFRACHIVVLDGYSFTSAYQKAIKAQGKKLVCIDDIHASHFYADAIINVSDSITPQAYSAEPYTQFYLGSMYVLLREPFLAQALNPARKINKVEEVFLSMGGADLENITLKILQSLSSLSSIKRIHVVIGAVNSHKADIKRYIDGHAVGPQCITYENIDGSNICQLLQNCQLAICPASGTSLEAVAVGLGIISGYTAENQLGILEGLTTKECILNAGDFRAISELQIREITQQAIDDLAKINSMILNQKKMVDGKSPERLQRLFTCFISSEEELSFRFAAESDANQYFLWVNDGAVRENSFNQNPVEYKKHVDWFQSKLKSEDCYFYLFFDRKHTAVGQVRIDKTEGENTVDISVDKQHRGRSRGLLMLKLATADFFAKNPQAVIYSYIKTDNYSSYKTFKQAGFEGDETVLINGCESYRLYRKEG